MEETKIPALIKLSLVESIVANEDTKKALLEGVTGEMKSFSTVDELMKELESEGN